MGFFHEQSRPDREDYVKIIYENIQPDKVTDFEYYPTTVIKNLSFPYDYSSIMHFGQSVRIYLYFLINNIHYFC